MALKRSQVNELLDPQFFFWATGIEDTFITAPWPKTGRTLDEYELTLHYDRWKEDLRLAASLGLRDMRYGIPWHRIQPSYGQWNWDFADRALEYILELGIHPIVDLVHYGLPSWIEGAFLNPDFPKRMAEYSARLASRFRGKIFWYTPLNEPRVTAWYCGKLGWWPPFRRGWRGFLEVMLGVCRGIAETVHALRDVDPEIVPVHVDATDWFDTEDPALKEEVFIRQELVFLALDLLAGKISETHSLHAWLLRHGFPGRALEEFQGEPVDMPLLGINLYPMFSFKRLVRQNRRLRVRMPYTSARVIEKLASAYWNRYERPLFISETASVGTIQRRSAWLHDSVAAVRSVRSAGIPLVGYTWWPLFALVTWAWRQGSHPPGYYLKQMGLWNLDATPGSGPALQRVETVLASEYRELVRRGFESVGPVLQPRSEGVYVS